MTITQPTPAVIDTVVMNVLSCEKKRSELGIRRSDFQKGHISRLTIFLTAHDRYGQRLYRPIKRKIANHLLNYDTAREDLKINDNHSDEEIFQKACDQYGQKEVLNILVH